MIYKLRHNNFLFYYASKQLLDKAVYAFQHRPSGPRDEQYQSSDLTRFSEAVINTRTNQMIKCGHVLEEVYESSLKETPTLVSIEDYQYQSYQEIISKVGGADDFMTRCIPEMTAKELMDVLVSNGVEFKVKERNDNHF